MINNDNGGRSSGVFSQKEMHILSLVVMASLVLILIITTYHQPGDFELGSSSTKEGELHPAILPLIAVQGGSLAQAAAGGTSSNSMHSMRFKQRLSSSEKEAAGPGSVPPIRREAVVLPLPLPLPLPAPAPKRKHPKPCFKDC